MTGSSGGGSCGGGGSWDPNDPCSPYYKKPLYPPRDPFNDPLLDPLSRRPRLTRLTKEIIAEKFCGDCKNKKIKEGRSTFSDAYDCKNCNIDYSAETCKNFKKGGCFISTAICVSLGKGDECSELNTLRQFRDEVILQNNEWAELVNNYYDEAPDLVEFIQRRPDKDLIWNKIWIEYLSSILKLIDEQKYQEAVDEYKKMFSYIKKIVDNFGAE